MYFLFLVTHNVKISSVTFVFCCKAFLINHKVFPKLQLNHNSPGEIFACKFLSSVIYHYIWYVNCIFCLAYRHIEFYFTCNCVASSWDILKVFVWICLYSKEKFRSFFSQIILFTSCDRVLLRLRGRARVTRFLPYLGKLSYCYMPTFIRIFRFYIMIYTWQTLSVMSKFLVQTGAGCIGDAVCTVIAFFLYP